jgi:hypothetical protein
MRKGTILVMAKMQDPGKIQATSKVAEVGIEGTTTAVRTTTEADMVVSSVVSVEDVGSISLFAICNI